MKLLLAVMAGGALGAGSRHLLNQMVLHWWQQPLFWATLIVNVAGSYMMGWVYQHWVVSGAISESTRLFLTVGLFGALTTWSTFSMEVVMMLKQGEVTKGLMYVLATTLACFGAFWMGIKT